MRRGAHEAEANRKLLLEARQVVDELSREYLKETEARIWDRSGSIDADVAALLEQVNRWRGRCGLDPLEPAE